MNVNSTNSVNINVPAAAANEPADSSSSKDTKADQQAMPSSIIPQQKENMQSQVDKQASEEDIKKAVDKINKAIMGPPTRLEYSVHHPDNTIVIKLMNTETNELIREVPSEKLLDINDKLMQLAGMMIDEKR